MPDVVVLVGGKGTRLQTVISSTPKALAPINGRPFLAYLLDELKRQDIHRVILSTGIGHDQVETFISRHHESSLEVCCVRENVPLDTAGGVRNCLSFLRDDLVLILNGDTFCEFQFRDLLKFHQQRNATATLLATHVDKAARFGTLDVGKDGAVQAFREKAPAQGGGIVSAGVLLINRTAIEEIPPSRPVSLEKEFLPNLCGRGLFALVSQFKFLDIGTPESYQEAQEYFRIRNP